jgi:fucose 4-O-acetylase-like acetyltransferase
MSNIDNVIMSERLNRIEVLRFPLIILIVLLHSDRSEVVMSGGVDSVQEISRWIEFIKNLLSQGIARAAVPLFFYISGYLYFAKKEFSKTIYLKKTKRRISSIVIPIIFWNAAVLAALVLAQSLPMTASYFSGNRAGIMDYSATDFLTAFTGVGGPMANAPFWFLRDLVVLCVCAPIVYWIAKSRIAFGLVALIGVTWFFNIKLVRVPSIEATFFFIVGAIMALKVGSPFVIDRYAKWLGLFAVILVPLNAYLQLNGTVLPIYKLTILVCFALILVSTRFMVNAPRGRELFYSLAEKSFFVYAAHGFLLGVLIKVSYKLAAPVDGLKMLVLYFLTPLCTIVICLIIYKIMFTLCPKFLAFITGGRTSE